MTFVLKEFPVQSPLLRELVLGSAAGTRPCGQVELSRVCQKNRAQESIPGNSEGVDSATLTGPDGFGPPTPPELPQFYKGCVRGHSQQSKDP